MQNVPPISLVGARRAPRLSISCDAVVRFVALNEIAIVMLASALARGAYCGLPAVQFEDLDIGALAGIVYVLIGWRRGLFHIGCLSAFLRNAQKLLACVSVSVAAVVVAFFFMKTGSDHSRAALALFYGFAVLGVFLHRGIVSFGLRRAIEAGSVGGRPVVTIGEAAEFAGVAGRELLNFGVDEVARFELASDSEALDDTDRRLVAQAIEFARIAQAQEFALVMNWKREPALAETLALLRESPLAVRLYPDMRMRAVLERHRGGHPRPCLSVEIQREPLRWRERALKRTFDVLVALAALVFLSPVLLLTAIMIKCESRGPAIFRQRRMGFDKRAFTIFKYRTMSVAEDGEDIAQAKKGDLRVTKIGALLRQSSIDELPQLWNVLRGEMSLVGPRPHALAHDREYSCKIAEYARRHHVRPGLTGAAQVRGFRGETRTLRQMADRVEWDLWYIDNWSFFLDLRIISQTFVALLRHEAF